MRERMRLVVVVAVMVSVLGAGSTLAPAAGPQPVPGSGASSLDALIADPNYTGEDAATLRLYRAFFNRDPDVAGAVHWLGASRTNACIDDIIWSFANSVEFQQTYGTNLSDAEFLTIVYSNVLGRAPDAEGFAYWLGMMASGLSRQEVVRWITANQELINRFPYAPATWSGASASYVQCKPKPTSPSSTTTTVSAPVYANCSAVPASKKPILRGQPGYGPHLDRDGDGRACEP